MEARRSPLRFAVGIFAAWILAVMLGLRFGVASDLDFDAWVQLRLPRVMLASSVGAALAVSGALLQALFTNPLCDPYTLGISSGAALGAVVGSVLGLSWSWAGISGLATIGALIFTLILIVVSSRRGSSTVTLLLTGVMLGLVGSSLVAVVSAVGDTNGIQSALFWMLGDLSRARLQGAFSISLAILMAILLTLRYTRSLDALMLGEDNARAIGVDVQGVRLHVLLWASFLISLSVSAAGMIGFVGLVVPHLVRRSGAVVHRWLIPVSAGAGALALVLADLTARLVMRPFELPVGVVCALIGAPAFVVVLFRPAWVHGRKGQG